MYYFCTYFDHHYLPRGLALYWSLKDHCPSFQLWVLCMDRVCYITLSRLGFPGIHLIALDDFERGDRDLLSAKQNRNLIEYYFTCTPSLALFILRNFPDVDIITYLDADLFFFADPAPVYEEIADYSIAIIEHRFPPSLGDFERFGIYNVGWLSFRRDQRAFACLDWWREQCIEWCYDRPQDGRFADQQYLDDWPTLFQDVVVLRRKGANLAPWNLGNYRIHADRNRVWVDEQPLIFFHFHGLKQIKSWLYDPNLTKYKVKPFKVLLRRVYAPYIRILLDATRQVSPFLQQDTIGSGIRAQMINSSSAQRVSLPRLVARSLKWQIHVCRSIFTRKYILFVNGGVI